MLARKLQLITLLGIMFGEWVGADARDLSTDELRKKQNARFFALIVGSRGEYCLGQSSDIAEWAMIKASSCKEASLWQRGKNQTVVLVADNETTELCLTREQNGFSQSLYVTLCYEGDNDSQSWGFNKKGELFLSSKKGDVLTLNPHGRDESIASLVVRRRF